MSDTAVQIASSTIGAQIDALFDLREKKRALEAQVSELDALIGAKELTIAAELEAQGLDRAAGRRASVGFTESVVPQIEDWDAYYAFIRRHNAFELLERRPAAAAFREHAERRRDKTVPGAVPFTKRKLSLRKI